MQMIVVTMQIKILIALATLFLLTAFSTLGQTIQFVSLVNTNLTQGVSYPLQPNQAVSLVGTYGNPTVYAYTADGIRITLPNPSTEPFQIFSGLTNLTLNAGSGYTLYANFQITTPPVATVVSNYVPADAIVIPASAAGNVQIILESSSDLVNWTAANPGTYGASAGTNRFFRVRAAVAP
jgi:hypothetical protein